MPMLIVYGVIAIAILGMLGGIGYKVRQAGADSVRAELQPKIAACEGQLTTQNAAIEAMRQEGAKKQATAAAALAKAEGRAKVWEGNAARLRSVLATPRADGKPAPTDCRAAWSEIRKP